MDNNYNNGQYDGNAQYDSQQYGQPGMNAQYGGQPQGVPYGNQYYGQQYYGQQKPQVNVGESIKRVQNEFKGNVSRMGLSMWCLLGIIGAMLLIVAPFMNFASIHINEKVREEGYYIDMTFNIKASDGLNLFELSKLCGTLSSAFDKVGIDKEDVLDAVEYDMDDAIDDIEDEIDTRISEGTTNEVMGITKLLIKGRTATLITPWVILVSGLGLLVFTVINDKKFKLVFSIIPLVCLIWLMICSSHFFAIMGIGAWALLAGIVLGIVSAVKDIPVYM